LNRQPHCQWHQTRVSGDGILLHCDLHFDFDSDFYGVESDANDEHFSDLGLDLCLDHDGGMSGEMIPWAYESASEMVNATDLLVLEVCEHHSSHLEQLVWSDYHLSMRRQVRFLKRYVIVHESFGSELAIWNAYVLETAILSTMLVWTDIGIEMEMEIDFLMVLGSHFEDLAPRLRLL
jgi:hypothetical protein